MMSHLLVATEIQVPPAQLFTYVSSLWESGEVLGPSRSRAPAPSSGRMGTGFRLPCPARRWAVPAETTLVVTDFREPDGWRASSESEGLLSWEIRIQPTGDGSLLMCDLCHLPKGTWQRLRDIVLDTPRRRRALEDLLTRWKEDAERRQALDRLRLAARGGEVDSSEVTD